MKWTGRPLLLWYHTDKNHVFKDSRSHESCISKKVWTIFGKERSRAIFAMLTFFGHFCFTITAEYCCNASSWSPPIQQCLWPAAEITSKHASRSLPCKSYLVFNFLLQQFSPNLLHLTTTTENPQPTNFIHDRFVTIKLQPSMDITAGAKAWRITTRLLISKCLFVFLPLDMCSGNINVPANNLRTRSLIVIYDNYMISFLQRGCFV